MEFLSKNIILKLFYRLCFAISLTAILTPNNLLAQNITEKSKYQFQAKFLYKIIKLTKLPKNIKLCVMGDSPALPYLHANNKQQKQNIEIITKYFNSFITDCNIIYVDDSYRKNINRILAKTFSQSILTIGYVKGFVDNNGLMEINIYGKNLRIKINSRVLEKSNIHFDDRIIAAAQIIK